jgi:hypothetical protein
MDINSSKDNVAWGPMKVPCKKTIKASHECPMNNARQFRFFAERLVLIGSQRRVSRPSIQHAITQADANTKTGRRSVKQIG